MHDLEVLIAHLSTAFDHLASTPVHNPSPDVNAMLELAEAVIAFVVKTVSGTRQQELCSLYREVIMVGGLDRAKIRELINAMVEQRYPKFYFRPPHSDTLKR